MINVECPWCAGSASVEVAEGGEFSCADCAIHVEMAPDPLPELVAQAA